MNRLTLVDAGRALHLSYSQTLRLLMRGVLDGERGPDGRWRITESSIERARNALHVTRSRQQRAPSARP